MRVKNVSILTIHLTKVEVDALDDTAFTAAFPEYGGYTIMARVGHTDGSMVLLLEWTNDLRISTREVLDSLIIAHGG